MTLKEFFKNDRYAAISKCELLEIREGYALARMRVEKEHLNAGDGCQGGAIFTLCDLAFAAAVNSHLQFTVSISSTISFHKGAKEGDVLTAEAVEIVNHKRAPYCEVRVHNQDNELIATFIGQAYRKPAEIKVDSLS